MTEPPDAAPPRAHASGLDRLLATKLYVPRAQPSFVPRPRLADQLDAGLARGIILVCAPAGFGKTALLADWARRSRRPVAWLSLDEADNDPARFWRYVAAALDQVRPGVGAQVEALLQGSQQPPLEAVATAMINQLSRPSQGEIALVLDDYHLIQAQAVHDSVAFLLDRLPPRLRLLLTSRTDPQLPLARLRGRGQLAELRAAELRFTAEEAAAFLREATGSDLPVASLAALHERTEGWAAGVQLAALSLQGHTDPAGFVEQFSGSHRYVLDYLTEEVLARQPEQVVRFLLETSVLERLSGPLCDAVCGRTGSQQLLEQIERASLFLHPLDEVRGWWRYHHLFADLLRARLEHELPERVPQLHHAAAAWHEQHGFADDAVRHALAAGEVAWAARLVEQHVEALLRRSEGATLHQWLSLLPDDAVRPRPALCLARALMQFHLGHLDAVDRLLEHAEQAFGRGQELGKLELPTTGGMVAELPAAIAVLKAGLATGRGDPERATWFARSALAQMAEHERGPRFWARWLELFAYWMAGRMEDAEAGFAEALARGTGAPPQRMASTFLTLARVQQARGKLSAALHTGQEGLRFATHAGRFLPFHAGESHVGIAQVLYERNELDDALEHVTKGIELTRQLVEFQVPALGLVTLSWIRQAMGQADAALAIINEACRFLPATDIVSLLSPARAERARLLLAQRQTAEAERWVKERGLTERDEVTYPREREYLVLARVLLAQHEPERALGLLQRLHALAVAQGRTGSVIEIQVLWALALASSGNQAAALAALAEALSLGYAQGYVRVFADEGAPMGALLSRLVTAQRTEHTAARSVPLDYLGRLLQAFDATHAGPRRGRGAAAAMQGLVDPLTARELEVLRLLAAGKPNREIAQELVVTLETVKKHASHIFDKLGAANRTQATARARELGLLR